MPPLIPPTVEDMGGTFYSADFTTLPENFVIPSSVKNMYGTFENCDTLTGTIRIDATPTSYTSCFYGCDKTKITIVGECGNKVDLLATADEIR